MTPQNFSTCPAFAQLNFGPNKGTSIFSLTKSSDLYQFELDLNPQFKPSDFYWVKHAEYTEESEVGGIAWRFSAKGVRVEGPEGVREFEMD